MNKWITKVQRARDIISGKDKSTDGWVDADDLLAMMCEDTMNRKKSNIFNSMKSVVDDDSPETTMLNIDKIQCNINEKPKEGLKGQYEKLFE